MFPIDGWLKVVRDYIMGKAPEILPMLDTYEGEARFGHRFIQDDLLNLNSGASVLEVGAGSLLLSCQLMREGFVVTALEPKGDGFSHFSHMQELILNCAEEMGCIPNLINIRAEDLQILDQYDYAFSINVMEHVGDIKKVIANVGTSLKLNAKYRFTCPNYLFPYEPHFNIPTFFSKKLTGILFHNSIFNNSSILDSAGLWKSLNWINVIKLRFIVAERQELNIIFNTAFFVSTLERIASDDVFAARRSSWLRGLIMLFVKLRIHLLAGFLPAFLQPIIDCTIIKQAVTQKSL